MPKSNMVDKVFRSVLSALNIMFGLAGIYLYDGKEFFIGIFCLVVGLYLAHQLIEEHKREHGN